MTMQIIRSHERFHLEEGWLKANWHFSFGHYHDPDNVQFGPLRVFNDDTIAPSSGFPMHPHRDMEIVTYVFGGALEHRDNMGNRGLLKAGDLQRMTAGTGVYHSEMNPSPTEPLRLCQIWVLPNQRGLEPSYEEKHFGPDARQGKLLPVVTPTGEGGSLSIHQDVRFYVSRLAPGEAVAYTAAPGRKTYLFVAEGGIDLNGQALAGGDQARITEAGELKLSATAPSDLILIDLP